MACSGSATHPSNNTSVDLKTAAKRPNKSLRESNVHRSCSFSNAFDRVITPSSPLFQHHLCDESSEVNDHFARQTPSASQCSTSGGNLLSSAVFRSSAVTFQHKFQSTTARLLRVISFLLGGHDERSFPVHLRSTEQVKPMYL